MRERDVNGKDMIRMSESVEGYKDIYRMSSGQVFERGSEKSREN